jgi:hypothetical protein
MHRIAVLYASYHCTVAGVLLRLEQYMLMQHKLLSTVKYSIALVLTVED